MNNKNKKIKLLLSFFIFSICGLLFSCNSAFAGTKETVLEKSVLQGLYRCYTTGAINKDAGALSAFHKFETLIIGGDSDGKYIALPAGLTGINDNNISCKGLFMGDSVGLFTESGSFDGLFKMFGKTEYTENITSDTKKTTLLKGMGYSAGSTSSTKNCVYYVYTNNDPSGDGESYTDKVCLSNGELSVETNNRDCGNNSGICMAPIGFQANGKTLTIRDFLWTKEEKVTYSGSWDKFRSDLNTTMSSDFYSPEGGDAFTYRFSSEKSDNTQSTDGDVTYTFSDGKSAAVTAIKFLNPSYALYGSLAFTDQEKLWYYENTITNWFYKNKSLDDYYKCGISENPSLNSQYIIINVNPSTGAKNTAGDCGVNKENTTNSDGIHGFDRSNHFSANGTVGAMDLASVVAIINSLVDGMDESELPSEATTEDNDDTKPEDTCMNSGGAGSLGWIACPILDWVSDSVQNIYSSAVAPLLQVDSKFFSNDEDVGTFHAWGIFQSMANIVFIILFLFVIFSQLTGVGIDNYGIKKIMPKLVVAAVLINLSYLICLICVDISNIAGNGIQSLFNGLDPGGSAATFIDEYNGVTSTHSEEVVTSSGAGATALTAVALVAILAGGFIAIWHNPALLLSLLVSALGVLIAILFLFVLLAGREAAIIVLTVISPLAFVCYILPNTKKFFDKWLKFWEGLLLVYPICGLLVGGGDFVSRLLLSIGFADSNFFMGFVTMVVGIIPIFFIPTVLKGAFAAMGNIGSAFANLGRTARGAATDKIRKSEGYKAVQQQGLDRSVRSKAGYSRRNDRLNAKGRLKSRFAKTGFARALGYGGLQSARVKAVSGIVDEEVESRASVEQALAVSGIAKKGGDVKGYYGDMLEKAGKSGSANNVNAVVAAMVNSGQIKEKDIADLMRKHINDGNIKIRNDGTMANVFREMATKYGSGFLSTDAELKDFMQKGGLDKSGNKISSLGNYGDYAKAGHMDATDIKKEDVTKLSGDSLSGLIKSGVLDQGMAQQMLAMNPNISNDKRIMLGAAANNLDISGMTAEQFKEAAKSVAQKPDDASTLIQGMSSEMAKALTSATPQSVNVVQNFRGGGRQIEPVDVNLRSNYREPSGYDDDTSTWD
ncbi:hypothetical protein [Candidatus Nanosyncoccus alces]|uniref:Type IV secretion system protein n=1 Tax=Candidatus Nanosyncoccus alces TaxID=2171997 RepID=A0ABY0FPJ5_9BACT|nr:hypothetical protein [Candidatus Nanosyncoccus alces]RYC74977.1 hypothetical protein G3RUM_00255 [Candidatus Nanosyncoccus alces]